MTKKEVQGNLDIQEEPDATGPVECLGMAFQNDDTRRQHFLEELRRLLQDPEFRKTGGFPIGSDEDILAMSDPPYYTACPNPWLAEFARVHAKPYQADRDKYHRQPLAVDVSVGKTDSLYKAHAYHTKVPHLAIVPSILHYTQPDDLVLDAFAGSGMTGVAAHWCGIAAASYRREIESTWRTEGLGTPVWGARRPVLNDLSPAATLIAANYNTPFEMEAFAGAAQTLLSELRAEIGWMYETAHTDGETVGEIEYAVWSEVFSCPDCADEIVFLREALDAETKRVRDEFPCPHCAAVVTKRTLERRFTTTPDPKLDGTWSRITFRPVLISYKVGVERYEKVPDQADIEKLTRIADLALPAELPCDRFPIEDMYHGSRIAPKGFTHVHHFFLPRAAQALGRLWARAAAEPDVRTRSMLLYFVEQAIWGMSVLARYAPTHFSQVNQYLNGVYYVGSQIVDCSPWYILDGKLSRLRKCMGAYRPSADNSIVSTGTATALSLPDQCIDYVFTDPPFGENIYYADLNFLVEAWHGVRTQTETEAIIDRPKQKELGEYHSLMRDCFAEYYRVLKPGRWMTVVFSNSRASVWNSIQSALQETGFVVASVSALDKKQGSFRAVTSPTAVKQDLVISAYKPDGGLEERFPTNSACEDGVWDFVRAHLRNLPPSRVRGGQLEFVAERDARVLFDRTVAFYIRHGIPVPLSAPEFHAALPERFPERDGMYFLPDQAADYDKKRVQAQGLGQLTIFVEDERSAVDWLRQFLARRPSKYQDIAPEFMKALTESWKKWETRPELQLLLDAYFLCYRGGEDVPPQIHAHLSTDYRSLRNLEASDPSLKTKAMDRWYVPDPKKLADVEKLRERRLLDDFWTYLPPGMDAETMKRLRPDQAPDIPGLEAGIPKISKGKRLKIVRTEAVRVGFTHCSQNRNYLPIVAVARHIPEDVVSNDDQLQMIVDLAEMRLGL